MSKATQELPGPKHPEEAFSRISIGRECPGKKSICGRARGRQKQGLRFSDSIVIALLSKAKIVRYEYCCGVS
jgi:hypothetical protein